MFSFAFYFLELAVSVAFPVYASYMALEANEVSKLKPWLVYWSVYSLLKATEEVFEGFLALLPFYSLARLIGVAWLVFPVASIDGTNRQSGCGVLYYEYMKPLLDNCPELNRLTVYRAFMEVATSIRESPLTTMLVALAMNDSPKQQPSATETAFNGLYHAWRGQPPQRVNLVDSFLSLAAPSATAATVTAPLAATSTPASIPASRVSSGPILSVDSDSSSSLFDLVNRSEASTPVDAQGLPSVAHSAATQSVLGFSTGHASSSGAGRTPAGYASWGGWFQAKRSN